MTDLIKQDRMIFRFTFAFFALITLALFFYEDIDLEKKVSEAKRQKITGSISDIHRSNSFVTFKVNGELFRSQEWTSPCLNIINEIELNRMVEFEYVYINKWPSFKVPGNCVLKAEFLTKKKSRSGRSKINT